MPINFDVTLDSSPKLEPTKPSDTKSQATIEGGKFENILADATAQQSVQPQVSSQPLKPEKTVASNDQASRRYGFAKNPSYGSGIGTAGFGSDAAGEAENSLKPADTAAKKFSFAKGPGYGSGTGTAGFGSDAAGEAENSLKPADTAAKKYAFAKDPSYGSGTGTAGFGSDAAGEAENSFKSGK